MRTEMCEVCGHVMVLPSHDHDQKTPKLCMDHVESVQNTEVAR